MPSASDELRPVLVAGRYALYRRIASGGMASVYYGRLFGAAGFSRVVAIKRLHPQLATDAAFVSAFVDEARLASRIRHPNVVPVLDVIAEGDEVLLVMEYVHGEKLSTLLRLSAENDEQVPIPIAAAVICDVLRGLHAAHEASSPEGHALGIVHRDVSPQNVLVSAEGSALVADFGIAKAVGRSQTTRDGQIKGKLAYMAYEQLAGGSVTRRTDIWAASIVFWEMLCGERLFRGDSDAVVYSKIMQHSVVSPSTHAGQISPELDAIVMRGLEREPDQRFSTALEMAEAIERVTRPATRTEVAAWVLRIAGGVLAQRGREVAAVEKLSLDAAGPASLPVESAGALPRAESTQVSTGISRPATLRTRRAPLWGLGLGLVVAIGVAFAFARKRNPTPSAGIEPVAAASQPVASAVVIAPAPAPPGIDADAGVAFPKAPSKKPIPSLKKPATGKQSCRVLGADGIWHIRPGCL